jgi:SsrA-binding protein
VGEIFLGRLILPKWMVKPIRSNHVTIKGAYLVCKADGVVLKNMVVSVNSANDPSRLGTLSAPKSDEVKVLLSKREIAKLSKSVNLSGFTLVPLRLLWIGSVAKIEFCLAKGKNKADKRAADKASTEKRQAARAMQGHIE